MGYQALHEKISQLQVFAKANCHNLDKE